MNNARVKLIRAQPRKFGRRAMDSGGASSNGSGAVVLTPRHRRTSDVFCTESRGFANAGQSQFLLTTAAATALEAVRHGHQMGGGI